MSDSSDSKESESPQPRVDSAQSLFEVYALQIRGSFDMTVDHYPMQTTVRLTKQQLLDLDQQIQLHLTAMTIM